VRWLLLQWIRRDFIVRYQQSALGVAWAFLQPALLLAVYGLVFTHVLHVRPPRGSYLVFAYCGLAPWTFFSNALSAGMPSLTNTSSILKQVYFPRSVIPLAAGGVVLVDLVISSAVLIALQAATAGTVHLSTLALIPLFFGYVLLVEALVVFSAVISGFVRDVRFVVPLLLQVGFIATPVMYPQGQVGRSLRWVFTVNPFAQVIAGVRTAVIDGRWPAATLILGIIAAGIALLALALRYTRAVEDRLPDLL
jgi:ABC-type polysaccharide/polyol phosphate export permease